MPPASPPSPRGDGGGGSGDGGPQTEEAVVTAAATRASPPAPLPVWGRRGRWPGPGCLRAPGAAASAPARGARLWSRPKSPGLSARNTGRRNPSASAVELGSNRPPTTDKLVSPPRGRPSAKRVRRGPSSSLVNPLSPVLRRVQGSRAGRPPGGEGARVPALLSGRAARAGLRRGVRATGPRVREVTPATEEPRGGIAPGRPAGIRKTIPVERDPEKRGKEESLRRLRNIRALAKAGAAARMPLADSASRARLAPSGRRGGAPRRGALPRAELRGAPS